MMITGPNTSGKVRCLPNGTNCINGSLDALFLLNKEIGVVDKIFTRVELRQYPSESLLLQVEMNETASILNNLSKRSLILLDEIGRGTSTYDGISIAWAIAEYLHEFRKSKTLFATHYHELNSMSSIYP